MNQGDAGLDPALTNLIRNHMPGAVEESIQVLAAMTALLAQIAYADGRYADEEQQRVRAELSLVLGFSEQDVDAICRALSRHMLRLSALPSAPATALLRKRFDPHMRADAIKVLIELAAADRQFDVAELARIRAVADELGVPAPLVDALLSRARELTG